MMQPMQISHSFQQENSPPRSTSSRHTGGRGGLWYQFRKWIRQKIPPWVGVLAIVVAILLSTFRGPPPSAAQCEEEDPFVRTKFCEPDGTCHEQPDEPSPRTLYSSWTSKYYAEWYETHDALLAQARDFVGERPLVFLGDSISTAWTGEEKSRAPGVIQEWMQSKSEMDWTPLVLAISGDQTQHLLWRLSHGELTDSLASNPRALYVLLIGINNLGSGELPGPTARGVLAIVDYLVQRVNGTILVLHVLPCGHGPTTLPRLCPPRCDADGHPFTSFLPAVDKVNQAVQQGIDERYQAKPELPAKLYLLDCGKAFLENVPKGEQVNIALMPDRLHPNAAGHVVLADCIESWIREHVEK